MGVLMGVPYFISECFGKILHFYMKQLFWAPFLIMSENSALIDSFFVEATKPPTPDVLDENPSDATRKDDESPPGDSGASPSTNVDANLSITEAGGSKGRAASAGRSKKWRVCTLWGWRGRGDWYDQGQIRKLSHSKMFFPKAAANVKGAPCHSLFAFSSFLHLISSFNYSRNSYLFPVLDPRVSITGSVHPLVLPSIRPSVRLSVCSSVTLF